MVSYYVLPIDDEDLRGMDSPTAWCEKCETNVELVGASKPLYTEV